jgi:hypothetical protein
MRTRSQPVDECHRRYHQWQLAGSTHIRTSPTFHLGTGQQPHNYHHHNYNNYASSCGSY